VEMFCREREGGGREKGDDGRWREGLKLRREEGNRGLLEVEKSGSSSCVVGWTKDLRGWPGIGKSGRRPCPSREGRIGLKEGDEEDWSKREAESSKEEEGWRMGLGERDWGHLARKSVKWAG